MFRNYAITALRNLARNKLHAGINIIGLAVGFAAAIFAALFVRYELTYNEWVPGYQRVYTIATTLHHPRGGPLEEAPYVYRDAARWLKLDFPEVEAAARIRPQGPDTVVRRGEIVDVDDSGTIVAADPNIFSVLPLPALAGDLHTALEAPDGLVITRSFARKFFGRDAPLGETVDFDQQPMRVTAVITDLPTNTFLPGSNLGRLAAILSARAPFSVLHKWDEQKFDAETDPEQMVYGGTVVRLKPDASVQRLQQQMAEFVKRHVQPDLMADVKMRLVPISQLHPNTLESSNAKALRLRFDALIVGVASVGALILLAACINYINGVTARAARRAIEVGVRKVSGAARLQLIVQFIAESLLYTAVAAVLAVGLVKFSLPAAQAFLDRTILFEPWRDPSVAAALGVAVLSVGTLAALYPAFVLSSLKPAVVLKSGSFATNGSILLRQGLVALQFAILIGITGATAVIYRQTTYAINESARLPGDQILLIRNGCTPAFKTEVLNIPGVKGAACGMFGERAYDSLAEKTEGVGTIKIGAKPTEQSFFDVYQPRFLSGQKVTADQPGGIVLNDTARQLLGFASPASALNQIIRWKHIENSHQSVAGIPYSPSRVVGVVSDYAFSVTDPVEAVIYYADSNLQMPNGYGPVNQLSVRLTGHQMPETLRAIDQLQTKLRSDRFIKRRFLDQLMQDNYRDLTQLAQLIAAFAIVTLFVATIGLFGLSALTAERRTKEIGIRKALGASRGDILLLLLWEFAQSVLWANLIALPAAAVLMHRWLQGFVYHIDIAPWMLLAASGLALVIAALTVIGHALQVARAKPVAALRYE